MKKYIRQWFHEMCEIGYTSVPEGLDLVVDSVLEEVEGVIPAPWPKEETFDQKARGFEQGYNDCRAEFIREIAKLKKED